MNADNEEAPDFRERIVVDPRILVGKPVVAGTRIPVSKILNLVAHGFTFSQIIDDYPVLTEVGIRAALLYAGLTSSGKRSSPSQPNRDAIPAGCQPLSPRNSAYLRDAFGFDAINLMSLCLSHLKDTEVIELARRDGRVVITEDLDVGKLYYRYEHGRIGIIVHRPRVQSAAAVNRVLEYPDRAFGRGH